MNRRNFLGLMSALPFVGYIFPKTKSINGVGKVSLVAKPKQYCGLHPMFGKIHEILIDYYSKYTTLTITFDNGTVARYKGYFQLNSRITGKIWQKILIDQVCSDTRKIESEWTYVKNKISFKDGSEFILMSVNIIQPLINKRILKGYF
jgi:hypothetical protein